MKMIIRATALALLVPASTASAQDAAKRSPSDAAAAFTLDGLPADDTVTSNAPVAQAPTDAPAASDIPAPDTTSTAAPPAAAEPSATEPAAAPAPPSRFTLDTPIAELIADPRSRKILDREMPGLSTDENLDKFRALSLRRFQPLTGGQLTDALLAKLATDLAAIPPAKPRGEGR